MKKESALSAWMLMLLSLPKGIFAFVIAITGICVSLPLTIVWVGFPLLAMTLAACQWILKEEVRQVEVSLHQEPSTEVDIHNHSSFKWEGFRTLGTLLQDRKSYQGIIYAIAQLPVGIFNFTLAVVLPSTFIALLLSPVAYQFSMQVFSLDLFEAQYASLWALFPDMTSFQRSFIAAGIGLVLVALLPRIFRGLGRLYTTWIRMIAS